MPQPQGVVCRSRWARAFYGLGVVAIEELFVYMPWLMLHTRAVLCLCSAGCTCGTSEISAPHWRSRATPPWDWALYSSLGMPPSGAQAV